MMGCNKINDLLREFVFPGQSNTIVHMVDDNACTLFVRECIMGIFTMLVFYKKLWGVCFFRYRDIRLQPSSVAHFHQSCE